MLQEDTLSIDFVRARRPFIDDIPLVHKPIDQDKLIGLVRRLTEDINLGETGLPRRNFH